MGFFLLCQAIDTVCVRDVFGTDVVAPSASYAHRITESFFIVVNFMHDLKAETVSLAFPEGKPARHVRVAVYLAGSPDSATLSVFFVVPVKDILHGETGTSRTDEVAASASDAAVAVFLPDFIGKTFVRELFRKGYFFVVLGYVVRSDAGPGRRRSPPRRLPAGDSGNPRRVLPLPVLNKRHTHQNDWCPY